MIPSVAPSSVNSVVRTPSVFGVLSDDNFARATLGPSYVHPIGPSSFACNGSSLIVSGGTNTVRDALRYFYSTSSEENTQTVVAKITSAIPSSGNSGIGPGFADYSSPDGVHDFYTRLITNSNSANFGKVVIYTYDGTTVVQRAISASALTVLQNDIFTFVLTLSQVSGRSNLAVTVTRTAGGSISTNWSEPMTLPVVDGNLTYSTGAFALYSFASTWSVTQWKIEINSDKDCDAMFIGDSITHGFEADDQTTRWASLVGAHYNSYVVSAGSGDGTSRVFNKMIDIQRTNPKYAFLMIGGNDVNFAYADREANYIQIIRRLKATGIIVVHCLTTPRTTIDITGWNTFIQTTYPNDRIIDTYTPLKGSGTSLSATYDSGDGVHPNQAGHTLIADTIIAYMGL